MIPIPENPRTIIKVVAVPVGRGGEKLVATFEDGTEAVLVQKTHRVYAVCAVHSKRAKTGSTKDCPESAMCTFHGASATPKLQGWTGDVIVKVVSIERK